LHAQKFETPESTTHLRVPPSKEKIILSQYNDRRYGSFFKTIEVTNEMETISDIICEAILIRCFDSRTVTDVFAFRT
jgi:hypothetical protein